MTMLTPDGAPVKGGVTAIGEQPIKGLLSGAANARMSVGEAVTNIIWAKCTDLGDIKAEGNWMWASKLPGEGALMYDTALALREVMQTLGVSVDGGKDSLSMSARTDDGELCKSPGEITVSLYCGCPDVTLTVTPDLKRPTPVPKEASIFLVQIAGSDQARCGGSVAAHCYGRLGDVPADCEPEVAENLKRAFKVTQHLIEMRLISAGHDRSDGGLAAAVLEMAFAGNCGLTLDLSSPELAGATTLQALFHEELGLVIEVASGHVEAVTSAYRAAKVSCVRIGEPCGLDRVSIVGKTGHVEFEAKVTELRDMWESSSFSLEMLQANPACVEQEQRSMASRCTPLVHAAIPSPTPQWQLASKAPKVAIIREEGSNGDREMAAAFRLAGFEAWDVTMSDLARGSIGLEQFRGAAFVGGFSYADTLGSAKGWAATARFQPTVAAQLKKFYERDDTFSLGVCNGCQLEHRLQWVPFGPGAVPEEAAPRLAHNNSARFESRFVNLRVEKSKCMWFTGMEGSILGTWSAHGEGRFEFPDPSLKWRVEREGLVALRYVDDHGRHTEAYPFNPNGSPAGIAALCTANGRHLAVMPHPERSVLRWQLPWMPAEWDRAGPQAAPWLQMFINAYEFCTGKASLSFAPPDRASG
uniref:Phosphoribosylformylglycinamidine synthase n=1 Tax=Pyrodinium bahamense TaxID=73915 RepID=A0A7S0AXS3_9DINO